MPKSSLPTDADKNVMHSRVRIGALVVEQGEEDNRFFVVESGLYEAFLREAGMRDTCLVL